ncbi:Mpo1 family 2-hydroxy fatty acid dioxygenase [Larkinella soli]|uniref:Mpo1 family 2-hydroxy fatty acid dioxygenase n=1 Tax=Larkinella soli TaxID=1770527 RepID=UPI000FFBDE73|nr:Mpo1-like protein [Larkinella soli]
MKTTRQWLEEYGESHQNPTNKLVHWICVPLIFFSVVGFFYGIRLPVLLGPNLPLNVAMILLVGVTIYYFTLSRPLSVGMALFSLICLILWQQIVAAGFTPWKVAAVLFVLAWIGQFWGHRVEGKKPSFFKDLQFLMIGPMWLMHFIYRKLGIGY